MNQSAQNSSTAEKRARSAKAPTISAQVMAAKVAWKPMKVSSGMTTPLLKVAPTESAVMPLRNSLPRPPKKGPDPPNVSE